MSDSKTASTGTRQKGECKWFNVKKGFGFITPADGSEDVFVHQSAIHAEGFRSLAEKEVVEYETAKDENGRIKAINVTGPNGAHVQGAPKPRARIFDSRRGRGGRGGAKSSSNGTSNGTSNGAPTASAPAAAAK